MGENEDRGKLSAVMLQCDILESICWLCLKFRVGDQQRLRSTVGDQQMKPIGL